MKAPEHLKPESKTEWRRFSKLFTVTEATASVLTEYFRAKERLTAAEAEIARDGLTVQDRFQQVRAHPACAVIRDCQSLMLRCLKELPLGGDKPTQSWSGGRKKRNEESRADMMARHREAVAKLAEERTQ